MDSDSFILLKPDDKREILGVVPSLVHPDRAIVTIQSQGVYLVNVGIFKDFLLSMT